MTGATRRSVPGAILALLLSGFYCLDGLAGELSAVPVELPPALHLPDLSGRPRSLDEFAGKVVLVSFWASWCRPCIEEIPGIRRLTAAMRDKPFVVLGVNVGEGQRRAQAAVRRLAIDFTVLLDEDSAVFERWGATVVPTAFVLDRNGRVRFIARGPLEWDRADIVDRLVDLTQQQPVYE